MNYLGTKWSTSVTRRLAQKTLPDTSIRKTNRLCRYQHCLTYRSGGIKTTIKYIVKWIFRTRL